MPLADAARRAGRASRSSRPRRAELRPDAAIVAEAGDLARVVEDPAEAAAGAHALYTDVWVSMGDESDSVPPA